MILQLVNRTIKLPRQMVKYVLMKVVEFIFPIDVVVVETKVVCPKKSNLVTHFLLKLMPLLIMGMHSTMNQVGDFIEEETDFDHEQELIL